MTLFEFLRRTFAQNSKKRPKKHKKRLNLIICNILEVDLGTYIDDSIGLNDYRIYYKVKSGKVRKNVIRHMKKNEDTYMFNTVQLRPITRSAYLVVIKEDGIHARDIRRKTTKTIWRVLLLRNWKGSKPRIIRIRR